jgi:NTP pyrophosphatase (non-canonical NTP hydrolase)
MKQFEMKHFDNCTLEECGFKILEEAAEVYAVWQELYKDDCRCDSCDLANDCPDYIALGDELYDVLQVCTNISALISSQGSFDGHFTPEEVDKDFMQVFLSQVALVHVYIEWGKHTTKELMVLNDTVGGVVDCVMQIAKAYGIYMPAAVKRGTQRNIERGRISADE